ncbi:MAG: DUF3782 domain-containing protein [Candidatus Edwardsbacteria bacterium]
MSKRAKKIHDGFAGIRRILKELAISQKKTEAEIDKLRESQTKTDEQLKKTDKQIGNLTDGWGKFVEGLVEPSVPKLFSLIGIQVTRSYSRALSHLNGRELEIDILCIGKQNRRKDFVIAVEVKSLLGIKEVKICLEHLAHFFEFFKEYEGWNLVGVVAGVRVPKLVKEYAEAKGLYVLAPSGETMEILNQKDFKPRIWRK